MTPSIWRHLRLPRKCKSAQYLLAARGRTIKY
jgi:hypothetical protein